MRELKHVLVKINLRAVFLLNITIIYSIFIGLTYCVLNLINITKIPFNNISVNCIAISVVFFIRFYFKLFRINIDREIFICLLISILAFFFSSLFCDCSYDGQMYHSEAIIKFTENWNPVYNHFQEKEILDYVFNHFAKSGWYLGAYLYLLSGKIEMVKGLNIIWMISTVSLCVYYLNSLKIDKKLCLIIGLITAINPIFLNTYLSNMIDYQIGACISNLLLFVLIFLHKSEKIVLFPILLLIIYFINLKFTALFYIFIFLFGLIGYLVCKKQLILKRKLLTLISISILSAVLIFGYHTYVKNYILHQHIFYPLYGEKDEILNKSRMVDAFEYRTGNRLINIVKSLFAKTTFSEAYSKPLNYKIPFMISIYELERYAFAGVIIGGFGVWYSGLIIFSILIFTFFIYKKDLLIHYRIPIYFLTLTVLVSVFLNPLWYIARYVPQYYFIPIITLFISYHFKSKRIFYIHLLILIVNLGSIMGYTYYNIIATCKRKKQLTEIIGTQKKIAVKYNDHRGNRALFRDLGIQTREVKFFNPLVKLDTLYASNVIYQIQ